MRQGVFYANNVETDFTQAITEFEATIELNGDGSDVKMEFETTDNSPFGGIVGSILGFRTGNDGITGSAYCQD